VLKESAQQFDKAQEYMTKIKDGFAKIKQKRHKKFMQAFNHISEQIDKIYKSLTQELGNAYLSLDNLDEPYLHGIRYHATPPYKGFREIEQLSGGEKTVAALALLFAFHSYKPSPFFVMDEVDASLDDNNVNMVTRFFSQRSADIQFILISLKERCYEKADALLGVSGAERKVSQVYSLDLTKFDIITE